MEDADGINNFTLSEMKKIKVIGQGAFASAVLPKHNGEEVVFKEMLCKNWDEGGKKIQKIEAKILNSIKNHKHVTKFKKVCYSPFVSMMH